MLNPRPRPPGKRPTASRRQSLAAIASASDNDSESTTRTAPSPPAAAAAAGPTLRNKLSSSSLSMAQPPDSPPDMYDYEPALADATAQLEGRVEMQTSPLAGKSTQRGRARGNSKEGQNLGPIPFPTSSASALVDSDDDASQGRAPFPTVGRQLGQDGIEGAQDSLGPPLEKSQLREKSREELERMLEEADRLIREKEQALSGFTSAGLRLVQDHEALRQRHDSLLSRTSATPSSPYKHSRLSSTSSLSGDFRDRAPSSPMRTWRTSLGYPPPSALAATTTSPHRGQRETSAEYESDPQHPQHPYRAAPTSPSTPFRSQGHRHGRISSASSSSVASLFASAPRIAKAPASPHELQTLSQANHDLAVQLSELEADSELAEQEAGRRLRKLERELMGLRKELERVEERNLLLEEERDGVPSSWVPVQQEHKEEAESTPRTRGWRTRSSPTTSDDNDDEQEDFAPPAPAVPTSHWSPDTPTAGAAARLRRTPGNGTPRALVDSPAAAPTSSGVAAAVVDSPLVSASAQEAQEEAEWRAHNEREREQQQDELVALLMAKIDELQETNAGIEDERVEMSERLEMATREVEVFKRKCEELEEVQEEVGVGWDDRKGIEWHSPSADPSAGAHRNNKVKGNRRAIERERSRRETSLPLSISDTSIITTSSGRSLSPTPRGRGKMHASGFGLRTLGSELGSGWEFEGEEGDEEEEDGDDERERMSERAEEDGQDEQEDDRGSSRETASTSTPAKQQQSRRTRGHQRPCPPTSLSPIAHRVAYGLETTLDALPSGSLRTPSRHSRAEQQAYEQLERVAGDLPAVWEDEDDFREGVMRGSPMKTDRRNRRSRGVHSGELKRSTRWGLRWEGEPEEEGEEKEEVERKALESGDMVERREREAQQEVRRRRKDQAREDAGGRLSRRELALRRLGLGVDGSPYSTTTSATRTRASTGDDTLHFSDLHTAPPSTYSDGGSYDSDDAASASSVVSDFSHLSPTRERQRYSNSFYPLTLRARYAPTMLAQRWADEAVQHVVDLVTYLRFFALLAVALVWAVWQGPKKTLGMGQRRRQIG